MYVYFPPGTGLGHGIGGGLGLGLSQSTGGLGGGGGGLGLSLGSSLSQPSLGVSTGPTITSTGTQFNLQLPPLGKRKLT